MQKFLVLSLMLMAAPAAAQHNHAAPPPAHNHGPQVSMPASPAAKAFQEANDKMHRDMAIPLTGNADVDFVQGMIPHHQGAVDMAKIVRQYGADPDIRKMAQEIIAAQEKEIALFRDWLAKRQK